MENRIYLVLVFLLGCFIFVEPLSLKFKQISTTFNNPIGIDYHPSTDSIVITSYYPSGNPSNFRRISFNGDQTQFSSAANLGDEIKIATVKADNSAGFKAGDLFTGNGIDGQILRITDNGNRVITTWCALPGSNNGLMRGSLYIDRTGVFGNKLVVVTTSGKVWTMGFSDGSCVSPSLLFDAGVHLEGVLTVENNVAKWGKLAGSIIAGDEDNYRLWAIYPNSTYNVWKISAAIEDLDYIEPGQNFFGVNYGLGLILGASSDQFVGHEGKILATQEFQGLWELAWDSVGNVPIVTSITTAPDSPVAPSQWEHVTFAPAGIKEILPSDFTLCIKGEYPGSTITGIAPIQLASGTAQANYKYNVANSGAPYSSASTSPAPQANTLLMYFTQDAQNTFSLVVMVDSPSDTTGGSLGLTLATKNLGSPTLVVQDDPTSLPGGSGDTADSYFWNAATGAGSFTWNWGARRTDGLVLSPLQFVGTTNLFEIVVTVTSSTGISTFKLLSRNSSGGTTEYVLPLGSSVTLRRTSCTCGTAAVDNFEQCDGTSCCSSECRYLPSSTVCRQSNGNCDVIEYCTGSSGSCPADTFQSSSTVCRASTGVCDPAETCTGSSASCPNDAKSTGVCRPAAHVCDVPESCNGVSANCPTDSLKPAGTDCDDGRTCTPTSSCTVAGACVGVDRLCVGVCGDNIKAQQEDCDDGNTANGDCCSSTCKFESSSVICRASTGVCDPAESCTGSSGTCPNDLRSTSVCRPVARPCDVPESCDGVSSDCPTDRSMNNGVNCDDNNPCTPTTTCNAGVCTGTDVLCSGVCGDGILAAEEECDDANTNDGDCCSSTCRLESAATVCRASRGPCDPAETCTGSSPNCPADQRAPVSTLCRGVQRECDAAEYCNPAAANWYDCPADGYSPNNTPCEDYDSCTTSSTCSNGACVGVDILCQGLCGDGTKAAGEECDDGNNVDGDCCSANCRFETSAVMCRGSQGVCDPAEYCTGTSGSCPIDVHSTSVCRPALGVCDVAESCNEQSFPNCPPDQLQPETTPCDDSNRCTRDSTCTSDGVCVGVDVDCFGVCGDGIKAEQEQCDDGNTVDGDCCSSICQFEPATTLCRGSAGDCDPAEFCTGSSFPCPVDTHSTAVCRPVQRPCDVAEYCDDASSYFPACPPDDSENDGTSCDDSDPCTETSQCSEGSCHGVDVYCKGVCGDNIVASGEQCDDARSPDCCDGCHFLPNTVLCRARGGVCDPPEYCSGEASSCPEDVSDSCPICPNDCSGHGECLPADPNSSSSDGVCDCDSKYTGDDCSIPICDVYSDCSGCGSHPDCGWCCETNTCVAGNNNGPASSSGCPAPHTWLYHNCTCSQGCLSGGGRCECSRCICPPGKGGDDCSWEYGCDGVLYAPGEDKPLLDVCSICGGNGTSCLGCDGVPFGAEFDRCGECGGNGRSCWNRCPYKNCKDCTLAEGCTWCLSYQAGSSGDGVCAEYDMRETSVPECREWSEDTCDSKGFFDKLTTTQKSLGATALVLIVVGSVAGVVFLAVGSKKGYDYYRTKSAAPVTIQSNPFYQEKKMEWDNPLYDSEVNMENMGSRDHHD